MESSIDKKKKFKVYLKWFVILTVSVIILLSLTHTNVIRSFIIDFFYQNDCNQNGEISNTNLTIALISIFGVAATFLAFYIQYEANKVHIENMKQSEKDISRERFENTFFEFISLFMNTINETSINGIGKGRETFRYMKFELACITDIVMDVCSNENFHENRIKEISFALFINGVSLSENQCLHKYCTRIGLNANLFSLLIKKIQKTSKRINSRWKIIEPQIGSYIKDYIEYSRLTGQKVLWFDGHKHRLLPYLKMISYIYEIIKKNKDLEKTNDYKKHLYIIMSEYELELVKKFIEWTKNDCNIIYESFKIEKIPNIEAFLSEITELDC